MKNESVAILDIRSNEVTFLLGARGVNGTFVFKGSYSEKYVPTMQGFYKSESFQRAVDNAVANVRKNYDGAIKEVYVGVPSGEINVLTKGHSNSYPSKRRLSMQDIENLYESGLDQLMAEGKCIRRSNMYFTLGDNRKHFTKEEVFGISTTMLKGALSYYFSSDDFYDKMQELLGNLGFDEVYFIPSTLAQATYLFPLKKREGYAFLLDVGYANSSISVVYGNGIVHEETFDCGIERIVSTLRKFFEVEEEVALEMLSSVNVSGGHIQEDVTWTSLKNGLAYPMEKINETIKFGLDVLCEKVAAFFDKYYKEKNTLALSANPISLTGEGVGLVKGINEHISRQLNLMTQVVYPDLPYYDKPMFSSRISLLDVALSDKQKRNWLYKIFNSFGGRKK